jgi:hypothetical protein
VRTARRRPSQRAGRVIEAIGAVLLFADEPMRAHEIHAAAEALLGEAINSSSVKAALAEHASGTCHRFERVSRGRYRPARRSSS